MITVAVIEDNRLVREGITEMLNAVEDMTVVYASTSVDTTILASTLPSVVLLDIGLQDTNCLKLAQHMQQSMPGSRVVVMDLLPVHEELVQFVNAGVAGFILKDATLDEFVGTIRAVAAGTRVLPPTMTTTLFSQIVLAAVKRDPAALSEAVRMTTREREVVTLIALGNSNKQIASELGVATDTVKSHVRNIMDKLMLHSRLQIAVYAHQQDQTPS